MKRSFFRKYLHGPCLALAAAALVVGVFLAVFFGVIGLRSFLDETIANRLTDSIAIPFSTSTGEAASFGEQLPEEPGLVYLSFTDLFSGFGWVNQASTTLFHDYAATAFTLPPAVSWDAAAEPIRSDAEINFYSTAPQLVLGGAAIAIPDAYRNGFVQISAHRVSSAWWLVGLTVKTGSEYRGYIFKIAPLATGAAFSESIASFTSAYPGVIGFGGSINDFVAVYGAYQGAGFRIQGTEITDISHLFDMRIMNGGFTPEVMRIGGWWYVWNADDGSPRLIKLFENPTGEITGVSDLTAGLPEGGAARPFASGESLFANFEGRTWKLNDRGFDISSPREVISFNLLGYPAVTRWASITPEAKTADAGGGEIRWFLSTDGISWTRINPGELTELNETDSGRKLFWKAQAMPGSDARYSVFLDRIRLDYRVRIGT